MTRKIRYPLSNEIEVDLREMDIIFAQMHVRMNTIAQITNFSITLAGGLVAAFASIVAAGKEIPIQWFLIIPFPFFVFAFLLLREDMLMAAHDRYFYQLRGNILSKLGQSNAAPSLRFLSSSKQQKIGSWFTILSGLRYCPPVIMVVSLLIWFLWNASLSFTTRGFLNAFLLSANFACIALLVFGGLRLGREHRRNEELVPQGEDARVTH